MLRPRGKMRPEDLDAIVATTGDRVLDWEDDDVLRFRISAGWTTLHEQVHRAEDFNDQWETDYEHVRVPIPEDVRRKLAGLSCTIDVEFIAPGDDPLRARFTVVAPGAALRTRLAALYTLEPAPPRWIARTVEGQILLDAGYQVAAARQARIALAEQTEEPHAAALLYTTLVRTGLWRAHGTWQVFDKVLAAAYDRHRPAKRPCGLEVGANERALEILERWRRRLR